MRNVVCTSDAPGVGHYSQAVKGGGFIFVSGQLALDPVTRQIIEGDASQQTERALQNVATVLKAAGASLDSVVRCGVFLKNMDDFAAMNAVYEKIFGPRPPRANNNRGGASTQRQLGGDRRHCFGIREIRCSAQRVLGRLEMKVLIVGIGALGGTIAARAINAGVPVRLAARNTDSAEALRRLGLRVSGIGGEVRADAIDGDQQRAPSSFVKVAPPELAVTKRRKIWKIAVAAAVAAGLVAGGPYLRSQSQKAQLTEKDTVVFADFTNTTGDAVFDDTLKQALSVALNQSPFLNVLPDNKVRATLKLMTRPSDTKLTPELARELCQRAGSKAYIAGSIASVGSEYVLGLKAVNCQSGDLLAQEQVTAAGKAKVLDAVGEAASKLRGELGESLATVQKFDVPLAEATTSSLEALKTYTLGQAAGREKGPAAALPYNQRAIQLDPNFASGYEAVGANYFSLSELGRASEYFNKAFELREHASEREKLAITATYYQIVTGELEKAEQTYQEWVESYPRDFRAHLRLGNVYIQRGQYEKAEEAYRASLRLEPDSITPYGNLAIALLALQRFDEARQIIRQAHSRKLDDFVARNDLYAMAFLQVDSPAMAEQQQWFAGQPDVAHFGLSLTSDTEAYAGHLAKARELTKRSVESAIHADSKEAGAIWQENAALREAAFGNVTQAKESAEKGLKLVPASQSVAVEAALAFAMAGDRARAESMSQDLNKRFPLNTQVQSLWLPATRAQLALDRRKPSDALNALQASAGPIEFGTILFVANGSCLYPTYVRGEAYLEAGEGGAAAAEFQKILDHSGLVWNCWTGALAHLGVARANALRARTAKGADADAARVRALAAYKNFLDLWKDADPDIPILKQAKAEYQFLLVARPPSASRAP